MVGVLLRSPRVLGPGSARGLLPVLCTVSLNLGSLVLLTEGLPLMPKFVLLSLVFVPEEPARVCWLKGMRTD